MILVNNKFTLNLEDKWDYPVINEQDTEVKKWTSDYVIELNNNEIKVSNPNGQYSDDTLVKYLKTEYNNLHIYVN